MGCTALCFRLCALGAEQAGVSVLERAHSYSPMRLEPRSGRAGRTLCCSTIMITGDLFPETTLCWFMDLARDACSSGNVICSLHERSAIHVVIRQATLISWIL